MMFMNASYGCAVQVGVDASYACFDQRRQSIVSPDRATMRRSRSQEIPAAGVRATRMPSSTRRRFPVRSTEASGGNRVAIFWPVARTARWTLPSRATFRLAAAAQRSFVSICSMPSTRSQRLHENLRGETVETRIVENNR